MLAPRSVRQVLQRGGSVTLKGVGLSAPGSAFVWVGYDHLDRLRRESRSPGHGRGGDVDRAFLLLPPPSGCRGCGPVAPLRGRDDAASPALPARGNPREPGGVACCSIHASLACAGSSAPSP